MDPWYWEIHVLAHGILMVKDYKEVGHTPLYDGYFGLVKGTTHGGRAMIDLLGWI